MISHWNRPIRIFVFTLSLFIVTSAHPSSKCYDYLKSITKTYEFSPSANIFEESWKITLASSSTWLGATQISRFGLSDIVPALSEPAFLVTAPLDLSISMISQWVSLGKLSWLKKITSAKGSAKNFIIRVGANIVINTSIITLVWKLLGKVELSSPKIAATTILTTLVYSTAQVTKPFFFKTIPKWVANKNLKQFKEMLPRIASEVEEKAMARAPMEIDEDEFSSYFFQALDQMVFDEAYESKKISTDIANINFVKEYLVKAKKNLSKKDLLKSRRKLVYQLLDSLDTMDNENREATKKFLQLDEKTTPDDSIAIIKRLRKSQRNRTTTLTSASLADQFLYVSVAGGVLLYNLTKWALESE